MKKEIWRVILCATAIFAVAAFLGCQTEETISGPVTLDDDAYPGVEGVTVRWYPMGTIEPDCYMEAWDRSVQPYEMFWYGMSDDEGYYEIPWYYLKYREEHLITIEAWKFSEDLYGFTNFVYDDPPEWVDVILYPE